MQFSPTHYYFIPSVYVLSLMSETQFPLCDGISNTLMELVQMDFLFASWYRQFHNFQQLSRFWRIFIHTWYNVGWDTIIDIFWLIRNHYFCNYLQQYDTNMLICLLLFQYEFSKNIQEWNSLRVESVQLTFTHLLLPELK
jgi:hypothetical protein